MNGDLLTDLDFEKFYNYHISQKSLISVAIYKRKVKIDFGVVEIDKEKNIAVGFEEKPEFEKFVSMGVYILNKEIFKYIPENKFFGFDDLMLKLLDKKEKISVYQFDGYWLDIGRPEDYDKANKDINHIFDKGNNK